MFDAKFTGMEQLIRKSRGLSHAVRVRLARNAVVAGAQPIKKQAQRNVQRLDDPETGRSIAKNMAVRYRKKLSEQSGNPTASVGVLYPKGRIPRGNPDDGKQTPHWHLLELGTEHMRAQPFLVPAAMQSQDEAITAFITNLERGIDREIKKL